ncbi:MAG: hypothetical protein QM766_14280 [Burkholderiaceae bacterium]
MSRRLIAALAFLVLAATALIPTAKNTWAASGTDPARFRLTPSLLDRMEAATSELQKLPQAGAKAGAEANAGDEADDDADGDDAESIEDIARKLDADPRVRAALARHGLSSREYATAVLAALHAGMVLAMEKAPGPKGTQDFTPEQRANVELMRTRQKKR